MTHINDIGIVGLGVMGSNLAINIAEKNFSVAVFNRTTEKTQSFIKEQANKPWGKNLKGYNTIETFAQSLKMPRKVLILVQAGLATESTIDQLVKVLSKNDIIVDTGNAHFKDQNRRAARLEALGLRFLAMGISGGEEGARKGPAFFPGGTLSVWEEIRPIIEAAAAKAPEDKKPCVTMNGRGGAGSCVKMYHNAGEYAILQIWGEAYDFLRSSGLTNEQIASIFESWKGRKMLDSYMLDISIACLKAKDDDEKKGNNAPLIDQVMDKVGSKGTGLWSAQEALEIGCPAPGLIMAVVARQATMAKAERVKNASLIDIKKGTARGSTLAPKLEVSSPLIEHLYTAVLLSIIASYAQMFQCLREQDKVHNFGINLPATIATFRAGCILKGYLLQPMTKAFENDKDLPNLICAFKTEFEDGMPSFRELIGYINAKTSVSIPVLNASLFYVNSMFTEVLKYGQLVSLQRDVFGRHGYERMDKEGHYSHNWPDMQ